MRKRVSIICPLERSVVVDLHSDYTLQPRYGTISVATKIRDAGYETRFFCEMSGSVIDWDYLASSQYICFSIMSFCAHRGYELMAKVRELTDAPIICGGSHPTVMPDECLEYSDYVIRNEGEAAIVELLSALDDGRGYEHVAGLSYKKNGRVFHNEDHEFIKDLDWSVDYSIIEDYRPIELVDSVSLRFRGKPRFHFPVSQATRGCPRNCKFCFGRRELGGRYRKRKLEAICADIKNIAKLLGNRSSGSRKNKSLQILFVDNDFCIEKEFTLKCLRELESTTKEYNIEYQVFTRIDTTHDHDFIHKLGSLGVKVLFLGIESINDETLRLYAKGQSKQEIIDAIKVCHDNEMGILGFFVLGADTDKADVVSRSVEFAMENGLYHITLFSLYDFPYQTKRTGAPQIIADHRFIHHDWRFFNSNFVVHFPMNMKPSTLQYEIMNGYRKIDSVYRIPDRAMKFVPFTQRRILKTMELYCEYLRSLEGKYYDNKERLIERNLAGHAPHTRKKIAI